jgi:2'-5' RNA ligase
MTAPEKLYMFAIMPPHELSLKIHEKRVEFSEKYKFTKALKPPVHITLYAPFKIEKAEALQFEQHIVQLQHWADRQMPFQIELSGYDFFANPNHPVIFIDVVKNAHLKELHNSFLKEIQKYMDTEKQNTTYKPHITIGFRDTTAEAFPAIRAEYSKQTFNGSFVCDTIYLWLHNGKNWEVQKEFQLKGTKEQPALF